jgi:hypothetical protein
MNCIRKFDRLIDNTIPNDIETGKNLFIFDLNIELNKYDGFIICSKNNNMN